MGAFKQNALTFAVTFCISCLVFFAVALIGSTFLPDTGTSGDEIVEKDPATENDPAKNPAKPTGEKVIDGNSFTVLLVGNDYQKNESHSYADSIMLVHFSCETGNVIFLPIPEITQVGAKGKNVTLAEYYNSYCGSKRDVSKLADKIADMTGVEIDYYICTSLRADGLADIVDKIGGIEFNVPYDMKKSDEVDGFTDLKKGKQTLDGDEATSLLRYINGSDHEERLDIAAKFFSALIGECEQHIFQAETVDVFNSLSLKTNIKESTIMEYLDTVYQYEDFQQLILTYPGDYILDTQTDKDAKEESKKMIFIANNTEAKNMLDEYVY